MSEERIEFGNWFASKSAFTETRLSERPSHKIAAEVGSVSMDMPEKDYGEQELRCWSALATPDRDVALSAACSGEAEKEEESVDVVNDDKNFDVREL